MPSEEADPVVASYDIVIRGSPPSTDAATTQPKIPRFYILQYPSHRPSSKPYSTNRAQKPLGLRIKQQTGIFEVDVPLLTSDNYNAIDGQRWGKAMHESIWSHPTTGHGLSGGFAHNQTGSAASMNDIPEHINDVSLHTQTLGGKVSSSTDRDPVYMLATLSKGSDAINLQHLDAVVQMRPQLHHIDAADEARRRAETKEKPKVEVIGPDGKVKLETKAIEMKVKDSTRDDPKDRNLNINAKLLRDIQNDPWSRYDWVEKHDEAFRDAPFASATASTEDCQPPKLKSALDNEEWLNRMSSPGIELRTRLKGRDRERARRKRQERAKASKVGAGVVAVDVDGSETGGSEDEDEEDKDKEEATHLGGPVRPASPEVQIKQESAQTVPASTAATPRKRGRPPKNQVS